MADPDAWAQAADRWKRLGDPFWTATARLHEAEAAAASGATARAGQALHDAHQLAGDLGAVTLLAQIEALSRRTRLGVKAPAPRVLAAATIDHLGLTPREAEVLALVAAGRNEPRDRRAPLRLREDSQRPRLQHPAQARRQQPSRRRGRPTPRRHLTDRNARICGRPNGDRAPQADDEIMLCRADCCCIPGTMPRSPGLTVSNGLRPHGCDADGPPPPEDVGCKTAKHPFSRPTVAATRVVRRSHDAPHRSRRCRPGRAAPSSAHISSTRRWRSLTYSFPAMLGDGCRRQDRPGDRRELTPPRRRPPLCEPWVAAWRHRRRPRPNGDQPPSFAGR